MAHRGVLSRNSKYFKTLFETPLTDKDQTEFKIPGIDGATLAVVVDFCYRVIRVDGSNVETLLIAASYLQVTGLEAQCIKYYKSKISLYTCLSIWAFAEKYLIVDLQKLVSSFMFRNFKEIVWVEEFLQLDCGQLQAILKSDHLKIDDEEEVFDALLYWVRFDVDNRRDAFISLLHNIRLQHVGETVSINF